MSAARQTTRKRPPTFLAYQEVEIDIDPEDLEREGWVYVGKDESAPDAVTSVEAVIDVVRQWHNEEHDGPWRWCRHTLCDQFHDRTEGATS